MNEEKRKALVDLFSKEHESFVLITCGSPDAEGNMDVDLSYGGDTALVSYLIRGASQVLDGAIENEVDEAESPLRLIK